MQLAARLDEYGKGAWIAVMVLAFIVFWPLGLAILAYLIWSGRMGCWKGNGRGRWHNMEARHGRPGGRHGGRHGGSGYWGGWGGRSASSGNSAFDEYREETLRRLEEEQQEFFDFLERLRQAKDKAEFDQFMADRKRRGPDAPEGGSVGPEPQPQA
jgi:hypothetical protein